MSIIEKHASDGPTLKLIFSSILLVTKIFRSLNAQVRVKFNYQIQVVSRLILGVFCATTSFVESLNIFCCLRMLELHKGYF